MEKIIDSYIDFLSNVMDMDNDEVKQTVSPKYLKKIPLDVLKVVQPKATIDREKVKSIATSFLKDKELQQYPILVNQRWNILDGNHRYLAAKLLGLRSINVIKVIVPQGYFSTLYYK